MSQSPMVTRQWWANGTNLAGDLEIGYYSYDPLNKYDKYFWLDVDGEYESI